MAMLNIKQGMSTNSQNYAKMSKTKRRQGSLHTACVEEQKEILAGRITFVQANELSGRIRALALGVT